MTHTYHITGMTCQGCVFKVQSVLASVPDVTAVEVDLAKQEATLTMGKHVDTAQLQQALAPYPKYTLSEAKAPVTAAIDDSDLEQRSFFATYKPVLLLFGYILMASVIAGAFQDGFDMMLAMRVFMAGFFLAFSFFKMLDLDNFADSYAMYDVIARRFRAWGYIYAFVELGLGIAYATAIQPVIVNIVTLLVMSVSIIGVLQSVLNKQKIRCACLGSVFNLPMSTLTIIEDGLMIAMSAIMLALSL